MCPPQHFTVEYAINPWMDTSTPVDTRRAMYQWDELRQTYADLGHSVELVEPVPGLPDMVYAANGGLIVNGKATVKIANGSAVVLYSSEAIAQSISKYGGNMRTIAWREL